LLESLLADIRFAVRWLRKSPGFALVAIASLAIGIGFNTALFAIVDAVLFKPLPVAAPARLVDIFTSDSTGTVEFSTSSYPDYLDLNAHNDVFEGLVGYSPMSPRPRMYPRATQPVCRLWKNGRQRHGKSTALPRRSPWTPP
jgi:hypothetical protein